MIVGVKVLDILKGDQIGEGKKQIEVEVMIKKKDRKLKDEDMEVIQKKIVESVEKKKGGVMRG